MMQYASKGVRHGALTRCLNTYSNLRGLARAVQQAPAPINLEAIRPWNPPFFSVPQNGLQRLFTRLTTPGLPVPARLAQVHNATMPLHSADLRVISIRNRLSFTARAALNNNVMRRQASLFLPRAPTPASPSCGGITQIGLGAARTFCTGRPIFQQLAENVPIAARALYEIDWDSKKMTKARESFRSITTTTTPKMKDMLKPVHSSMKLLEIGKSQDETISSIHERNQYFPVTEVRPVTSYLLIPLAPTSSSGMPLPNDLAEPKLLPPLSYLVSLRRHSTHTLKVRTIFDRLDQAAVWTRGVHWSAYSVQPSHREEGSEGEDASSDSKHCDLLKVTFNGWTKAEVRGVIGESGTGWCVLKEVHNDYLLGEDLSSSIASLEGSDFDSQQMLMDPAQSFVLPTLDFSSSFLTSASQTVESATSSLTSVLDGIECDLWADDSSESLSDELS